MATSAGSGVHDWRTQYIRHRADAYLQSGAQPNGIATVMRNAVQAQDEASVAGRLDAGIELALVRLTIGALFVWVFFAHPG
jgi:hypothetical protein